MSREEADAVGVITATVVCLGIVVAFWGAIAYGVIRLVAHFN